MKTDKVDARMLADLLRADMIPEAYVPGRDVREVMDLVRRRHYMVKLRTMLKNKVHAELVTRWIAYSGGDVFTEDGKTFLRSLSIDAVNDYLDTIEFLSRKLRELDEKVKKVAESDEYAKLLVTIPGVGHYAALLISSEIADIKRFPDYANLCSYARLSPGVRQSGETQHMTRTTGDSMLNWIMVQCTRIHVRRCESSVITRFYQQVSERRGEKVAIVAAARKLMRAIYIMLEEGQASGWMAEYQLEPVGFLRHSARLTGWATAIAKATMLRQRANRRVPIQQP